MSVSTTSHHTNRDRVNTACFNWLAKYLFTSVEMFFSGTGWSPRNFGEEGVQLCQNLLSKYGQDGAYPKAT